MPLLTVGTQQQYKPWGHSDMNAVLSKLPDISRGGQRWLTKLTLLTHGTDLAVGDLRALLGAIMSKTKMAQIEEEAYITDSDNEESLLKHITSLSRALTKLYPTPKVTYQSIRFKIKPGESASAYLHRYETEWEDQTGENPDASSLCQEFYRQAVIKGVPGSAAIAIENSPDMSGGEGELWVRHFIHHVDKTMERQGKEESEVEKLKTQLLKMQIEAEKDKNKKKGKEPQQMIMQNAAVAAGGPNTQWQENPVSNYSFDPLPDWPPPGNRPQRGQFNRGRGRGQPMMAGTGGCFLCGGTDHWRRECPKGQWRHPPARGRAPFRGAPQGRGVSHNVPWSVNQQVPNLCPVWDQADHADY